MSDDKKRFILKYGSAKNLDKLARENSSDPAMLMNIAKHPSVSQDTINHLAKNEHSGVRVFAARHSTDKNTLADLSVDQHPSVVEQVAANKHTDQNTLKTLSEHPNREIRSLVSENESASENLIHDMALKETDPRVKYTIARSENIGDKTIHHFLDNETDHDSNHLKTLAVNKNLKTEHIDKALDKFGDSENFTEMLTRRGDLHTHHIQRLVDKVGYYGAETLALYHPLTTSEKIKLIQKHGPASISYALERNGDSVSNYHL